jgi:myosin heavy subunit
MGLISDVRRIMDTIELSVAAEEEIADVEPEIIGEDAYDEEDEDTNADCNGTPKTEASSQQSESQEASNEENIQRAEARALTYKKRSELPTSSFALVQRKDGKALRRFPIHDLAHARNALQRLPQTKDLSDEERAQVKRRAERALQKFSAGEDCVYAVHVDDNSVFEEAEIENEAEMLRKQVSNLASDMEKRSSEFAEVKQSLVAEKQALEDEKQALTDEVSKLKDQVSKLEATNRELAEASASITEQLNNTKFDNTMLKRCIELGGEPNETVSKVIASMTDEQFAVYVEAAKQKNAEVNQPRKQIVTVTSGDDRPKITLR